VIGLQDEIIRVPVTAARAAFRKPFATAQIVTAVSQHLNHGSTPGV
jgi:hypothetical protein